MNTFDAPTNAARPPRSAEAPAEVRRPARTRKRFQVVPIVRVSAEAAPAAAEPYPERLPPAPAMAEPPPDPLTLIQYAGLLCSAAAVHVQAPTRETTRRYLDLVQQLQRQCAAVAASADPLADLDLDYEPPHSRRGKA